MTTSDIAKARLRPPHHSRKCSFARSDLKVSFEEPEVLVEFTGQLREHIRRDGVFQVTGFLHSYTERIRVKADVVHQKLKHRRSVRRRQIGFLESRFRGGFPDGSVGHATESCYALRDRVNVIFKVLGNRIE